MELKATHPLQYDSPDLDWNIRGSEDRPSRRFFRDSLDTVISPGELEGKKVLDIGCGVGQMFNWLKDKKAAVVGIDPSARNITSVKQDYPWAESHQSTLQEFAENSSDTFDAAFAVLVFEHIHDLPEAFDAVKKLLNPGGKFYLVTADKEYHLIQNKEIRKRVDSVEVLQELENGAVEIKTISTERDGSHNVLYDIVRPTKEVLTAADGAEFTLVSQNMLLNLGSSYKNPMCHMFVFKI